MRPSTARRMATHILAVTLVLLGLGASFATPSLSQEASAEVGPSPTPSVAPGPSSERRDLYLDMPYTIGGFEPDIVMTRGQEHLAGLDPGVPEDARTIAGLEGLLEATGADIEDMTSGYALVSQEDFFAFVVALRIAGARPGTLMPAYLPILLAGLDEPSTMPGSLGGKDVLVVTSAGDDGEAAALYVYDEGDTIWMIQAPEDVAARTLEGLPG